MFTLQQRIAGALFGGAIGDAMGAPVEGWPPQKIAARFNSVQDFLPPTHGGDPAKGKGGGRITDDTLMVEALMRSYVEAGDHLDAHGFERYMIPHIAVRKVWVPERQEEIALVDRLWWPEKYPWMRLTVCRAEPRSAGRGNCVNCGVAMYVWPIGAVNAGDPRGAYHEAVEFGLAHNESFALEAAGVMAGTMSACMAPDASLAGVLAVAADLGRDGTGCCIRAALAAAKPADPLEQFIAAVRRAIEPFDQRSGHVSDDAPLKLEETAGNVGRPSRLHSIEELPAALAALKWGDGDLGRTIHAGVFYGRDCDSIAGMAGSLHGAIHGPDAIPSALRSAVDKANRRDFAALAAEFHGAIARIARKDRARWRGRQAALSA